MAVSPGGIRRDESPEQAMFRSFGRDWSRAEDVSILGSTADWLRYRLPEQYVRRKSQPLCIGQKQRWFLLRLLSADSRLQLDTTTTPEFDRWRWVQYWQPLREVIFFKREVYRQALHQLGPIVFPQGLPPPESDPVAGDGNGPGAHRWLGAVAAAPSPRRMFSRR